MIDPAVLRMLLDERLVLGPLEHPHHRARKKTDPVAAKMDVRFLAGQQQKFVIREPGALVVHRLQHREGFPVVTPRRAKPVVKLGQVHNLDAGILKHINKLRLANRLGHSRRRVLG